MAHRFKNLARSKALRRLKSPWVLGVGASIGAGVPPLVVPAGWPLVWRALIAAVVAALAGASGSYFGVVLTRAENAVAAIDALHAFLDPLSPPWPHSPQDPAGGERGVFELLLPESCPTPFWGRRGERDWWWAWCHEPAISDLLVVDGPGGCGKTRLASRAAEEAAAAGWVTGWLREGRAADLVDAAAAVTGLRVLVLVDNADIRSDLPSLLGALARYQGRTRLRVVLIARHGAELGQALQSRIPERHALLVKNAPVMSLRPLGETSDLIRWYGEAVRAFASALATPAPPVSDTIAPVREGQTMVEVLAQAMVTVLSGASPTGSPAPLGEVAEVLFEHEARWWRGTAALDRWGIGPVSDLVLARVMAGLALFAPADEPAAIGVLRRIPELADASVERVANLVRWAHALYPGGGVRIGPNLLTDWFVTVTLTRTEGDRDFARHLLNDPAEDQACRILTVLARAGEHHPPARLLFERLLGGDPVRLARHAVYAALTTATNRGELDHTTATALAAADLDPDTTTLLLRLTPAYALPRCALILTRRQVHHTRATGTPLDLAHALIDLAGALERMGEHHEQLRVAQESTDLWRGLAARDPANRPHLARALTALAAALHHVGELREEVRMARESVALCRALADDDPAYQPDLGRALGNLSVALDEVGEHHEQLRVAREAVALCRALAGDDPASRPVLGRSLIRFAVALGRRGEHREQLRVAREAVVLGRVLTEDDPAYRPDLGRSLIDLAVALGRAGEYREEMEVAREAVALYREVTDDNPAHRPDLAHALTNLAFALNSAGERHETPQVAREAVALYRELAAHDPELFRQAYIDNRATLRRLLPPHSDEDDITFGL
ncbi:tetratricopeptide repeat protein [Microbispora sp. GKU 823]|uniref:tetratricopeptide repeat protein n=1 Tax=Microbispora sp. GKU 823 TaxID=1652100 RepID=UPI0009A35993|nr:tetratricopeptide repeat protein [Microbispora sp. GKU 823]OPG04964.1 hypothetical protein B1L11_36360 [Microbispora sp. GKU 823]